MADRWLRITLERGMAGKPEKMKKVLYALGLRRRGQSVQHKDVPTIRGMIRKVSHLIKVEEAE